MNKIRNPTTTSKGSTQLSDLFKHPSKPSAMHHGHSKSMGRSALLKKDISSIPEEFTLDPRLVSSRYNMTMAPASMPSADVRGDLLMKYHSRHTSATGQLESIVKEIVSERVLSPVTCSVLNAVAVKKRGDAYMSLSSTEYRVRIKNTRACVQSFRKKVTKIVENRDAKVVDHAISQPRHETNESESDDKTETAPKEPTIEEKNMVLSQQEELLGKLRTPNYLTLTGTDDFFLFDKYPMIQFDSKMMKSMFGGY